MPDPSKKEKKRKGTNYTVYGPACPRHHHICQRHPLTYSRCRRPSHLVWAPVPHSPAPPGAVCRPVLLSPGPYALQSCYLWDRMPPNPATSRAVCPPVLPRPSCNLSCNRTLHPRTGPVWPSHLVIRASMPLHIPPLAQSCGASFSRPSSNL